MLTASSASLCMKYENNDYSVYFLQSVFISPRPHCMVIPILHAPIVWSWLELSVLGPTMILPGCQTSDSVNSSKFHNLSLLALLVTLAPQARPSGEILNLLSH